jgi:hypothetical protein
MERGEGVRCTKYTTRGRGVNWCEKQGVARTQSMGRCITHGGGKRCEELECDEKVLQARLVGVKDMVNVHCARRCAVGGSLRVILERCALAGH